MMIDMYECDIRFDLFKVALAVGIQMDPQVGNNEVVANAMDLTEKSLAALIQKGIVRKKVGNEIIPDLVIALENVLDYGGVVAHSNARKLLDRYREEVKCL